ncbi:MAG: hypothetical protein R6U40_06885 [Desulfobacterales bacterium]
MPPTERSEVKLDNWFNHADIIKLIDKYHSQTDILMPVYYILESVLENEYLILLSVKANIIKSYINVDGIEKDITNSDKPFTRKTPRGREFLPRIRNRFSVFPDAQQGLSNYFRKTNQEVIAQKKDIFSEGRHKLELSLKKELIREDLKINKRKGLLCFDIFRYSEKTLNEMGCHYDDEVKHSEHYIYQRFCRNINAGRFRMKSVSAMSGRILI